MKKVLILVLAASMLFSLTGCARMTSVVETAIGNLTNNKSKNDTPNVPTEDIMGEYSETANTYENRFAGIGFRLEPGWEVLSQEQIAELNGMTGELLNNDNWEKMMEATGTVMPFYACTNDMQKTVNLAFENLSSTGNANINEDKYADLAESNIRSAYSSAGVSITDTKKQTVTFAGEQHIALFVSTYVNGATMTQLQVYKKVGNYMAVFTLTDITSVSPDQLLSMFYAL